MYLCFLVRICVYSIKRINWTLDGPSKPSEPSLQDKRPSSESNVAREPCARRERRPRRPHQFVCHKLCVRVCFCSPQCQIECVFVGYTASDTISRQVCDIPLRGAKYRPSKWHKSITMSVSPSQKTSGQIHNDYLIVHHLCILHGAY